MQRGIISYFFHLTCEELMTDVWHQPVYEISCALCLVCVHYDYQKCKDIKIIFGANVYPVPELCLLDRSIDATPFNSHKIVALNHIFTFFTSLKIDKMQTFSVNSENQLEVNNIKPFKHLLFKNHLSEFMGI